MSSSELVNGKENSNESKKIDNNEREIIDLDEKLRDATNNEVTKNDTVKNEVNEELKNNFKKILAKNKQKQSNYDKNDACIIKSIIEDLNQKNKEIYNKIKEQSLMNDISNNTNVKDFDDNDTYNINENQNIFVSDNKITSNDDNVTSTYEAENSYFDANTCKNEINKINQKLDSLCMKINEERIKNDLENKNKFKKLLDTVSSHLNVQLVNTVENTIKREVKSGILQLKKTVGESVLSLENKSTNIINEITQTKTELPENKKILETIKTTMIDVFLPVIESCFEEMKSQIMVEIKKSICMPENTIKTVSMKDEVYSLLQNENVNDACVLALDCGDDILHVFVENCSVNLLEKLEPNLQVTLLKKSVNVFSDYENERTINFISNVLMILEIQDLNVNDLIEIQNILEFLSSIDTNENMRLIIKMQGNQIRKLIVKKRR
ncbi:hypothetical protein BDAP_000234 [Binucleata daphniae]